MSFSQEHQDSPYEIYRITHSYLRKGGVLQVPVANADDTAACELIKVSGATMTHVVSWIAERLGDVPHILDPYWQAGTNANEVLDDWEFGIVSKETTNDGSTHIYRLSGTYYYKCSRVVDIKGGTMAFPTTPIDDSTPEVISPGQFGSTFVK